MVRVRKARLEALALAAARVVVVLGVRGGLAGLLARRRHRRRRRGPCGLYGRWLSEWLYGRARLPRVHQHEHVVRADAEHQVQRHRLHEVDVVLPADDAPAEERDGEGELDLPDRAQREEERAHVAPHDHEHDEDGAESKQQVRAERVHGLERGDGVPEHVE